MMTQEQLNGWTSLSLDGNWLYVWNNGLRITSIFVPLYGLGRSVEIGRKVAREQFGDLAPSLDSCLEAAMKS